MAKLWLTRNRLRRRRKVVLGSGGTEQEGWFSTDISVLNVCHRRDFDRVWSRPSVTHFLAEHVWEHLYSECAVEAVRSCACFLLPAGRLRIAVPDGRHPSEDYISLVRPNGTGPGAEEHQCLYTVETLSEVIELGGLDPIPLEWWDESGRFHQEPWFAADGFVERSADHDPRNVSKPLTYTSLIIDGIKRRVDG